MKEPESPQAESRGPGFSQTCRDCGETKPYEAFVKRSKGGRLTRCKDCQNARQRQRRAERNAEAEKPERRERAAKMERLAAEAAPRLLAERRAYLEGVEAHYQRHGTYRLFPAEFRFGVPLSPSGPPLEWNHSETGSYVQRAEASPLRLIRARTLSRARALRGQ